MIQSKNIMNLISLWEFASKEVGSLVAIGPTRVGLVEDSEWPNRIWINGDHKQIDLKSLKNTIQKSKVELKLTIFESYDTNVSNHLKKNGFSIQSVQRVMDLQISSWVKKPYNSDVILTPVITTLDAVEWSALFKDSFGYLISAETIFRLITKVQFYTIYNKATPVGTVILYITDKTAGIHSLGVVPEARGQGMARSVMVKLLNHIKEMRMERVSLQASERAVKMYKSLGFIELTNMLNFKFN